MIFQRKLMFPILFHFGTFGFPWTGTLLYATTKNISDLLKVNYFAKLNFGSTFFFRGMGWKYHKKTCKPLRRCQIVAKKKKKKKVCFCCFAFKSKKFAQILENFAQTCVTKSLTFRSSETYLWEVIWLQGVQGKKMYRTIGLSVIGKNMREENHWYAWNVEQDL